MHWISAGKTAFKSISQVPRENSERQQMCETTLSYVFKRKTVSRVHKFLAICIRLSSSSTLMPHLPIICLSFAGHNLILGT